MTTATAARIVETKDLGQSKVMVTVECDQQEGVTSLDARNMAQSEAGKTLSRPGVSTQSGPYPVDADGKSDDAVMTGQTPVAAYRQDFTFQGGL